MGTHIRHFTLIAIAVLFALTPLQAEPSSGGIADTGVSEETKVTMSAQEYQQFVQTRMEQDVQSWAYILFRLAMVSVMVGAATEQYKQMRKNRRSPYVWVSLLFGIVIAWGYVQTDIIAFLLNETPAETFFFFIPTAFFGDVILAMTMAGGTATFYQIFKQSLDLAKQFGGAAVQRTAKTS